MVVWDHLGMFYFQTQTFFFILEKKTIEEHKHICFALMVMSYFIL